jgi:hypothetical protein
MGNVSVFNGRQALVDFVDLGRVNVQSHHGMLARQQHSQRLAHIARAYNSNFHEK